MGDTDEFDTLVCLMGSNTGYKCSVFGGENIS